jgi:predicted nucleic acid-binding Zn ribbon protein
MRRRKKRWAYTIFLIISLIVVIGMGLMLIAPLLR